MSAYSLRFELCSNDPAVLQHLAPHLPLGWQAIEAGEADIVSSLRLALPGSQQDRSGEHLLSCEAELLARTPEVAPLLTACEKHAELLTAYRAQDCLFVHA